MKKVIIIALAAMLCASCGVRKIQSVPIAGNGNYTINGKASPIQFAGIGNDGTTLNFSSKPVSFPSYSNSSLIDEDAVQLAFLNEDINNGDISFSSLSNNSHRGLYIYRNDYGWHSYADGSYRISKDNNLVGDEAYYNISIKARDSLGTFELQYSGQLYNIDYNIPIIGSGKINGNEITHGYYSLYYMDEKNVICTGTLMAGENKTIYFTVNKNMFGKRIHLPQSGGPSETYTYYIYYNANDENSYLNYDNRNIVSGTMVIKKSGDHFQITIRATMADGFEVNVDFTGRLSWSTGDGC